MFTVRGMHKDESGQTALETAIILIAFIVVASVFAFAILSAGSASTEKGQQAINAGLEGVQSSMNIKGSVLADGTAAVGTTPGTVDDLVFTVALVSGGDPVDMTPPDPTPAAGATALNKVVIGYRDATTHVNDVAWTVAWIGANDGDNLLEAGELAELTVTIPADNGATPAVTIALGPDTPFTIEIKPPTGSILSINRTTPASIEAVMDLK